MYYSEFNILLFLNYLAHLDEEQYFQKISDVSSDDEKYHEN